MRELKFRAWDEKQEQMIIVGNERRWGSITNGYIFRNYLETHIMQYTGLHDKNGKEIYEGDILKHPRWRSEYKCKKCGHNPKESQTFLVFWQNKWHHDYGYTTVGRWALEAIGGFDEYELNESEKYEVIGNKFQNPELLDQ